MNRILITSALLVVLLSITALAAEGSTYQVKYGASDPQEVYDQILAQEFPDGGADISRPPANLYKDTTAYIAYGDQTRVVNISIVMPKFLTQEIPAISASSSHNQSVTALTDYIYKYCAVAQTNPAYEEALGTSPTFELAKYSIGREYNQAGKTYTLTQMYMEQTVTQKLTVTSETSHKPNVSVNSDGTISCSPETVQYSTDRDSWSSIRDGAAIPGKCFGDYVYFRTPAGTFMEASEEVRVYIKDQQSAPTTQLKLSATSFSVEITNSKDYERDCEFSIDGKRYSSKTTWDDLNPNTKYTVYVRFEEDSKHFASTPISATVTTKEGISNSITYDKSSNAHTTYFVANGTTKGTIRNTTLEASYSEATLSKLKDAVKDAEKKMSAVTVLNVSLSQEEGDSRQIAKVKFSMPNDMGLLQLKLGTPFGTIIVSDNSSTLEIEKINSTTSISNLKEFVESKDLVYKVVTAGDGSIQVLYPWEFPDRANLSSLQVCYMDTKYSTEKQLKYQVVENGILFTLPDDGYFSIKNLHKDYGSLPFSDCQTHWAYSYIHYAYEAGLVNGVSTTEFSPNTHVTRAQIAVLLARMAGADSNKTYQHSYTDVPAGAWYEWAVGYLYQQGALKDQGTGLFSPEESVTREQMSALTAKVFPYKGTIWSPLSCSDRGQIATYAITAIDGLFNRNVLQGDEKGNFNPTGTLTRAEFVAILYRLGMSLGAE